MSCEHETFVATVEVNRLTETEGGALAGYSADIRVMCADCEEPFSFRGAPLGLSQYHPTQSVDGLELRAPIHPISDPLAGIGLPGFGVEFREGSG